MGEDNSNAQPYLGLVDELRVSNTTRSAGWILTEYNSQNSPATFSSLTSEQSYKSWDGGAGTNNWGDANNWNPDAVPTSSDDVGLTGANSIDINDAVVCNSVMLNNAGLTLTVKSGQSLTVTVNMTLTNGTLDRSSISDRRRNDQCGGRNS